MAHHQRTPPGDGRPETGQDRRYPDRLSELRALMGANVHRRSLSPFDMARQLETLREVL